MKSFPLGILCSAAFWLAAIGAGAASALEAGLEQKSYPVEHLGAEAQRQYAGDGIGISATPGGALLRADFQKLEGHATADGLWMKSLETPGQVDRFRVKATAIGRAGDASPAFLADQGAVRFQAGGDAAAFFRPGLTEEYRTSMDGVRQDFLVAARPARAGELSLALDVAGARVESAPYGVKLTLMRSGREIAYSRLQVTDAEGKELAAHWVVSGSQRLEIRVDDAQAVYPVRIDPTFSDADWLGMEGSPGANGTVYATAVDGSGNLYIGGSFTQLGAFPVNYIAKWNGSVWTTLGSGVDGEVRALVWSGSSLYVGGAFTNAGGSAAGHIAKWDGSNWSTFGTGMNGNAVLAILLNGTDIYAGGDFSQAGGTTVNNVARWNGTNSTWNALGSGTVGTTGVVKALAVFGTDIYVGGRFDFSGGIQTNNIARYNGVWNALGTAGAGAAAGTNNSVNAIVIGSDGFVYVGGGFTLAGQAGNLYISRWNGSAWASLGTGLNSAVTAMAVSGTSIYVGGSFTTASGSSAPGIARWNISNTTWNTVGTGLAASPSNPIQGVNAIAVSGSNVYAAGDFLKAGTLTVNRVSKFDGTSWTALRPAGINGDVNAVAVSGATLYVGGTFTSVAGVSTSRIAKWDGSNWSAMGAGISGPVLALAVSGTDVYAGGNFVTAGGTAVNSVAKWNGTAWSAMATGVTGNVLALAASGTTVYAGGTFTALGAVNASHIAKWDGTAWTALGSGVNGDVNVVALSGTNVYAGGLFTTAGGSAAANIAKWNGTVWSALGAGTSDEVAALLVSGTDLYVGGAFVSAGGVTVNHVAKWNGTAWSAIGTGTAGVDGRVNALALSGSYLYAGGLFANAGGSAASSIARWNGLSWGPLGSGTNNVIKAMAASSAQLFVGGSFTSAGAQSISFLAQAVLPPEPEINLLGNGQSIASGNNTPSLTNFTDFGPANVANGTVTRTFVIANLAATSPLTLTGTPKVAISGTHAADFTVTSQPVSPVASPGTTSFDILFNPSASGLRTALVTIASDDANEDPYTFAIQGTGGDPEIAVTGNGNAIPSGSTAASLTNFTDFGNARPSGGTVARTFTIANSGTAPLSKTAGTMVSISGGGGTFTVQTQPSSPIALGSSTTFTIVFAPAALGVQTATVHIANDDADEGDYSFDITGLGAVPGSITFHDAVYTVIQGVPSVVLTFDRTGGALATKAALDTNDGPASTLPPYAAAIANKDYADLTGAAAFVNFPDNVMTQTVTVSLPSRTGALPNRRFTATLSAVANEATLGAITTAAIQILASDTTKPTLTLKTPTAGAVSALSPYTVTGVAGDAHGLADITVKLNDAAPEPAVLGAATVPTSVPFSLVITPVEGNNTLVVTATDLRGNVATVTRTFTFSRRYVLTLNRVVPAAVTAASDKAGTVAMAVTPASAATALAPATANSNPKTATVVAGKSVKLTATAKTGYAFYGWTGLPGDAVTTGDVTTFLMPAAPITVTATFVENPFTAPPGMGNSFYGLIHADGPSHTIPSNGTEGFLTAAMTATGGLTGKLYINGVIQSFTGTAFGDGSTIFTVSGAKKNALVFGSRSLSLHYNAGAGNNTLRATLTNDADLSAGDAKRALHSTANKVGATLLNTGSTKGAYTVIFPAKQPTSSLYPAGTGFATIALTNIGDATFAGTLADGSAFTAASALVEGETAPLFAQLATPGAAATVKGGSFGGTLTFLAQTNTDVTGTALLWFRPAVVAKTTPAAVAAATNLYTDGWPEGITVDAIGALYSSAAGVQFSLGIASPNTFTGNAELRLESDKLVDDISYQNIKVDFNSITKIPATEKAYTITATPASGLFSGTFTPVAWVAPGTLNPTKPAFKGILIQKGANKGGYGFFLGNALNDPDPESGAVIFRKLPAGP